MDYDRKVFTRSLVDHKFKSGKHTVIVLAVLGGMSSLNLSDSGQSWSSAS